MKREKHPGGTISRPLDIELDNRQRVSELARTVVLSSAYAAVEHALWEIDVALTAFPPPHWERAAWW